MKAKITAISLMAALVVCLGLTPDSYAQSREVTGTVTSADGTTLPGVSILVKGTSNVGTATDVNGNYSLQVPVGSNVLVFSFIGFETKEVIIGNRSVIDVQLERNIEQLDDVVVTGYGSQIEEELTGNIGRVSGEEISTAPVNSLEAALQGRVAGVRINSGNGKLGQAISVKIRGASSITAGNQPLYVIDGIPIYTQDLSTASNANLNPLASLNLDNIKSISILKDASAAAIYGSRGSNGVVIITTKEGQRGPTQYSVSYQVGFSEATGYRDFLNGQQYIDLFTEAAINGAMYEYNRGGNPTGYASEQAAIDDYLGIARGFFTRVSQGRDWRTNPFNTNWQEQAFQDGANQRFNISASGGDDDTRFFVGGSYSDATGILIDNNYTKFNGRVNLDHTANNDLQLGVNLSVNRSLNDRLAYDNSFETPMQLVAQPPLSPLYVDADGDPTNGYQQGEELIERPLYANALDIAKNNSFTTSTFHTFGKAYANYQIMPNLEWQNEFGIDLINQREEYYYNTQLDYYVGSQGSGYSAWTQVQNYNVNSYLTYLLTLNSDHNFEIVGGSSYNWVTYQFTGVAGENFPNDNFQNLENAANITSGSARENNYSFLSFFTRANYDYKGKYLATLSIRADGSSRFGKNNRFGYFPAVSAGWILTKENFLSEIDFLSFLKLRASYGLTGNANIDNFAARGLYEGSAYVGNPGMNPDQIPNQDLKWENTAQYDIGIDFGFFDERINGKLDYYHKSTTDLLLSVNLPGQTGYLSQFRNVGSLENYGFEAVINTINTTGEFFWSTNFNFAINRNTIKDINGQVIGGGFINRAIEGYPIGTFYAYEYAGVDPDNGDALYWINSSNPETGVGVKDHSLGKTNNPNLANQVPLGNPNPNFVGGLGNSFSWKGFELNMLWQFVYGNKIYNGAGVYMSASAAYFDNQTADQLNAWQESGDITNVPEARLFWGNGLVDSSRWLYDGSYIRLKSLTVGYNLGAALLERLSLRRARIFITGSNLLTFTEYPGWDPEVNTDYVSDGNLGLGSDFYAAPQPRTISVGVDLGF
ncbi:MAG TPA: TonB-dependent receptor [Balneolaceae bacterium]